MAFAENGALKASYSSVYCPRCLRYFSMLGHYPSCEEFDVNNVFFREGGLLVILCALLVLSPSFKVAIARQLHDFEASLLLAVSGMLIYLSLIITDVVYFTRRPVPNALYYFTSVFMSLAWRLSDLGILRMLGGNLAKNSPDGDQSEGHMWQHAKSLGYFWNTIALLSFVAFAFTVRIYISVIGLAGGGSDHEQLRYFRAGIAVDLVLAISMVAFSAYSIFKLVRRLYIGFDAKDQTIDLLSTALLLFGRSVSIVFTTATEAFELAGSGSCGFKHQDLCNLLTAIMLFRLAVTSTRQPFLPPGGTNEKDSSHR